MASESGKRLVWLVTGARDFPRNNMCATWPGLTRFYRCIDWSWAGPCKAHLSSRRLCRSNSAYAIKVRQLVPRRRSRSTAYSVVRRYSVIRRDTTSHERSDPGIWEGGRSGEQRRHVIPDRSWRRNRVSLGTCVSL